MASKRIMIATPHHRDMEPEYIVSTFTLVHALSQAGFNVLYRPVEGGLISKQRNVIGQAAIEEDCEYLLQIDSDSVFDVKDVMIMLDMDKNVVGSLYRMKIPPFLPIAYRYSPEKGDGYFTRMHWAEIPHEPFVVGAIGAGLLLVKVEFLKLMFLDPFVRKFGQPFNLHQRADGIEIGEDMAFCMRVRQLGEEVWCHPSENMGHAGTFIAKNGRALIIDDPHYCNDVEGWMRSNELNWLYQEAKKYHAIVEIGSWKGRSTLALLNGTPGTVTAIDTFKGSEAEVKGPHREAEEVDIRACFDFNTKKFQNIVVHQMENAKVAEQVGLAEMIFIDAGHTKEEVLQDLKIWEPKATKLICGHDFDWPSVQEAVCEYFGTKDIQASDTIWYVRKGE